MTIFDLSEKIRERDLVLGELSNEAVESAESNRFMAALSCLFLLMEQSIKFASDEVDGNLSKQIGYLEKQGKLSMGEVTTLHDLRQIRNKLFHENNYMWGIEDGEGKIIFLSEFEGKEKVWNLFAEKVFIICLNLLIQP